MPAFFDASSMLAQLRSRATVTPAFAAALYAYVEAINREHDFDAIADRVGAQIAHRFRQYAALHSERIENPSIGEQVISRPIIITGLPRSGTTFLHSLVAQDPTARTIATWQAMEPFPPVKSNDRRILSCQRAIDAVPLNIRRAHAAATTAPEECNAITALAFQSADLFAMDAVPDYAEWYKRTDHTPAYRFHRQMLQYFQTGAGPGQWVLKSPSHLFHLPALVATYPDALIVIVHRDPTRALPSLHSLICKYRRHGRRRIDEAVIGTELLHHWKTAFDRSRSFIQSHHVFNVQYDDLLIDPLTVVRDLYTAADRELTDDTRTRVKRFIARNPKNRLGEHHYPREPFGMDVATVRALFNHGKVDNSTI